MGILYILRSESSGGFYVGSTDDLDRRLSEHPRGHTPSTRARGPWKLVHIGRFESLPEARRREFEIKRWKSAKLIRAPVQELPCMISAAYPSNPRNPTIPTLGAIHL
ncbi:MAG: GIY-YIG nuclease family protein [Candidatus Acidiferrales bacterium]